MPNSSAHFLPPRRHLVCTTGDRGPLGEHPAVVVARTWNQTRDHPNTFIVAPPASTRWVTQTPKTADKLAHAGESPSSIGRRLSAQAMPPRAPTRRAIT